MAAAVTDKFRKLARKWVGQVGAGGVADDSTQTIPFSSTTGLPTDTATDIVLGRVDSSGTKTPAAEETITTVISGSNGTNSARGEEGTAQAHLAGVVAESLLTANTWNDLIDGILVEHGQDGTHTAASTTAAGTVEIATAAETTTGTDATRAVSPDGLAGSIHGRKTVILKVIADDTDLTTGDGKMKWTVPADLNGMDLVDADACVYTASSSGTPTIQIHNLTDTTDMLSTRITIDESELNSFTAATPPVIDTGEDDVVTGDVLRIDVDVAGTDTTGLDVILVFQTP